MKITSVLVLALVAILCLLNDIQSQEVAGTRPCSARMLGKLEGCCKSPKLLMAESFLGCTGELFAGAKPQSAGVSVSVQKSGGPGGAKRAAGLTRGQRTRAGAAAGAAAAPKSAGPAASQTRKSGGSKSPAGGVLCMMECVLRNQSLLTASNDLKIDVITKKFLDLSDDTWKPIVKQTIANCSAEVAKVDLSGLSKPAPGGKVCKSGPALFMTCVRRSLALNCPTASLNATDTCTKKIERLKGCNPFSLKVETAEQKARKTPATTPKSTKG